MGHWHEVAAELAEPTRSLREVIPDTWGGFAQMHREAFKDGVLPAALKEVIALAIAAKAECDGCITYHARGAARRGATPEQVAEALGVVLLMMGGPGTTWAPRAWQAFQEYYAAQQAGA